MKQFNLLLIQLNIILLCFSGSENLLATEVDSFTNRHELADSRPKLNQVVNRWLAESVAAANWLTEIRVEEDEDAFFFAEEGSNDFCDQRVLIDTLNGKFAGFLIGQLESLVNKSTHLDSIKIKFENSIYRDFRFSETPTISLTEKLAVLIRIGDTYLGSDKLGHFFTEGFSYYEIVSDLDEYSALKFGEFTETILYGGLTTGVYSYSDLAANFNGLRFWNRILALKPDPLSHATSSTPYVSCVNKQWQLAAKFDWADYVDPTWDEAINCSAFRNDILLDKVKKQIAIANRGNSCPLINIKQEAITQKYGDFLQHLYNPDGNKALPQPFKLQFASLWSNVFKRFK